MRTSQEEPQPPDWNVWEREAAGRPRQDHSGQNTQEEPTPPGLERAWESGGQKRRRQERRRRSRNDADRIGCNTKSKAMEMQRNRDEDEDKEMPCSSEVDGALMKLRSGPVHEAAVMQRCSQEDKA